MIRQRERERERDYVETEQGNKKLFWIMKRLKEKNLDNEETKIY